MCRPVCVLPVGTSDSHAAVYADRIAVYREGRSPEFAIEDGLSMTGIPMSREQNLDFWNRMAAAGGIGMEATTGNPHIKQLEMRSSKNTPGALPAARPLPSCFDISRQCFQ